MNSFLFSCYFVFVFILLSTISLIVLLCFVLAICWSTFTGKILVKSRKMQHTFQERWFQEIAESAKLSPLSPEVINTLLPIVELHIRKIIQNAHKHQRHSKCGSLKGNTYCFCLLQESSMFRS
jgi:hypothetical protein